MGRTGRLVGLLAVLLSLSLGTARAQEDDPGPRLRITDASERFDTAGGMFLAAELVASGPDLVKEMFARGYPTTPAMRQVTGDEGFAWGLGQLRAVAYGRSTGVPLARSPWIRNRMVDEGAGSDPVAYLQDRLESFASLTGVHPAPPGDLHPVFLPFAGAEPPALEGGWPDRVAANPWAADSVEQRIDAAGAGFAGWAATRAARATLSRTRVETTGRRRETTYLGRTAEEGFLGLVLLDVAAALVDAVGPMLCAAPHGQLRETNLVAYDPFSEVRILPPVFEAEMEGSDPSSLRSLSVRTPESRLRDQAAWLLFASELFDLTDPEGSFWADIGERVDYGGHRAQLHDQRTRQTAQRVASFVLRNLAALHWNPSEDLPTFCSTSRGLDTNRRTPVLDARDAGLVLLALARVTRNMQGTNLVENARTHLLRQADFLLEMQADDGGFHDAYDTDGDGPQGTGRSTEANMLVIQGLLATHAATGTGRYLDAAERALAFCEDRYLPHHRVWADEADGRRGRLSSLQAGATLGLLRDAALAQDAPRLLHRYRSFWLALRRLGFPLAETPAADRGEGSGSDRDGDGIERVGSAGLAPVFRESVIFEGRSE